MSTPSCVNLQERFGNRYRINFDEADDRTRRVSEDPWMYEIRCRFGVIYPHGGSVLGVMVDNHPGIAKRLRGLACCRLYQDGEREKTFLFDVADFDKVAAIVLPHRKPQFTEAQKQVARERIKAVNNTRVSVKTTSSGNNSSDSRPAVPA